MVMVGPVSLTMNVFKSREQQKQAELKAKEGFQWNMNCSENV